MPLSSSPLTHRMDAIQSVQRSSPSSATSISTCTRTTYRQRCHVEALRDYAAWSTKEISQALKLPLSTVGDIYSGYTPRTPSKRPQGIGMILRTPQRDRLVEVATESAYNRRRPLTEIAELAGIKACNSTLRTTFARLGYHRRIARIKPFLTQLAKDKRLAWALEHAHWTVEDWSRVIWTDECALKVGEVSGNIWVTRRPDEEYHEDCLQPKFRKRPTVMIWGCMIGEELGPMVIWKKEWGTITSKTYTEHIIDEEIAPFYQEKEAELGRVYLMEDGASPHRAAHSQNARDRYGILSLPWPASSPDLNPIESLWHQVKSHISKLPLEDRPSTIEGMKLCIKRTWAYLSHDHLFTQDLVASMPERIQAVIAANGGHTRW